MSNRCFFFFFAPKHTRIPTLYKNIYMIFIWYLSTTTYGCYFMYWVITISVKKQVRDKVIDEKPTSSFCQSKISKVNPLRKGRKNRKGTILSALFGLKGKTPKNVRVQDT